MRIFLLLLCISTIPHVNHTGMTSDDNNSTSKSAHHDKAHGLRRLSLDGCNTDKLKNAIEKRDFDTVYKLLQSAAPQLEKLNSEFRFYQGV